MKTILITGTFDLVHLAHMKLFKFAKNNFKSGEEAGEGIWLIVAIDSDVRVRKTKGEGRPFNSQQERIEFLKHLCYIDDVLIFNDDEELRSICFNLQPDIRIVGSDYKGKEIIGSEFCNKVVYFDRIEPYSSSRILSDKK